MWRKIIPVILFNLIVSLETFAQVNLVPNADFEAYDTCPMSPGLYNTISYAIPWFQPYLPQGSSDYFNSCDTLNYFGVPNNVIGSQLARSGSGYAGITCLYDLQSPSEYREYLEIELLDTLKAGNKYCVEFYVSRADLCRLAFANIGAFFSNSIVTYNAPPWGLLTYVPQINSDTTIIISDTSNWTLINGYFIANGGEKFMLVGSFTPKLQCNDSVIGLTSINNIAYYYFDDFSVIDCTNTGMEDSDLSKDLEIFPNPVKDILKIKFGSSSNGHDCLLTDLTGKIILRKHFSSEKGFELDLSSYPAGVYFLNVNDGRECVTRKVVHL